MVSLSISTKSWSTDGIYWSLLVYTLNYYCISLELMSLLLKIYFMFYIF